jgi:hypothetical protein
VLLFPAEVWELIDAADWSWGYLNIRSDPREGVATISHVWRANDTGTPVDTTVWQKGHYLRYADVTPLSAVWYHADPDLHVVHDAVARRTHASISTESFRSMIKQGWVHPTHMHPLLVVAISTPKSGGSGVSVWRVDPDQAAPEAVSVVDEVALPTDFIKKEWPVQVLSQCRVAVVGIGSIGSLVAETLAGAGVGELVLIDHDRLEQRNLPRHRLTARDLGRFKVHAMCDVIKAANPATLVDPLTINVVTETDILRPVVADSSVVVCAADGVSARRVTNHVARRAMKPAVLAAVLEDGGFGEVIRVRQRTGCLYCLRLQLIESGAFDPEPGIDLGYGTGTAHRPMTAAPSDLQLVAALAAKVALSTMLEARGSWNQRLPGDYALLGLQPTPDMPPPFDLERAGEIKWFALPDRRADCPTCAQP